MTTGEIILHLVKCALIGGFIGLCFTIVQYVCSKMIDGVRGLSSSAPSTKRSTFCPRKTHFSSVKPHKTRTKLPLPPIKYKRR